MEVVLKHHTPLWVASEAIRTCWQSQGKADTVNTDDQVGPNDRDLIYRVGNKFKHSSTLEHLTYNFQIKGVSRALLQEQARHRMANLSVKSSRYTLKELKDEKPFLVKMGTLHDDMQRASKYLVFTDNAAVNQASLHALDNLRDLLVRGVSNDIAKYAMPENYKTELAWTINARALQNFLALRSSKAALWEIRDLANLIFETLPDEHKYLFEDYVQKED